MKQTVTPVAEYSKSAKGTRVLSQYENDLIFEQPRDNLLQQEFVSYEYTQHGIKKTVITRKFKKSSTDYFDTTTVSIIGS
jgi:hypothetical protein